jgi:hypothetical protein
MLKFTYFKFSLIEAADITPLEIQFKFQNNYKHELLNAFIILIYYFSLNSDFYLFGTSE